MLVWVRIRIRQFFSTHAEIFLAADALYSPFCMIHSGYIGPDSPNQLVQTPKIKSQCLPRTPAPPLLAYNITFSNLSILKFLKNLAEISLITKCSYVEFLGKHIEDPTCAACTKAESAARSVRLN